MGGRGGGQGGNGGKGGDEEDTAEREAHGVEAGGSVCACVCWSVAEKKALLAFVKDRKGDEFGLIWEKDGAWEVLEREWKSKCFATHRTARALGYK